MSRIELLPFQAKAAEQIAGRFADLLADEERPSVNRRWDVPYYQALAALTGAGKTPILADAVAQMRAMQSIEPLVLWVSKAKAVVDQTHGNFQAGGKYEGLVEGFLVGYLGDLRQEEIRDASVPRILLSTVGAFNQKDRADGTLRVHKIAEDTVKTSLWADLRERSTHEGRRPLIIVYDEGHNLSDQQTELLLELEPDAILLASATMRTPARLGRLIDRLRDHGWDDNRLVTAVSSRDVVEAGLVKRQIVLGGFAASLEATIEPMLEAFDAVSRKAETLAADFAPKAIYVCRTNVSQEEGTTEHPGKPFRERRAPPILIWRHLVEQWNVDPSQIAVYCDLKFDRKSHPPPEEFILFSGGEEDFAVFREGGYRHIIFNLALQEGWDDPECCFAYVDKSMGSRVQIEQVIGRVLRQPGARHYPDPDLNTAEFFVRMDDRQQFAGILDLIRKRVASEIPEARVEGYVGRSERSRMRLEPKEEAPPVPSIHIDSDAAVEPLRSLVAQIHDYREDRINTVGAGERVRAVQAVGMGAAAIEEAATTPHSNPVTARWLLRRGIQAQHPEVVKAIDWVDKRFDARIEIRSPAARHVKEQADQLVDTYLDHSELICEEQNLYRVGPAQVRPERIARFEHALHEGYSDLNEQELAIAREIDRTGLPWVRNPSTGGYAIPLLTKGTTRNFFPDFLVWKNSYVFAIDPKGEPYLPTDAGRKLLAIRDAHGRRRVIVRLVTEGRWLAEQRRRVGSGGYTVWSLSNAGTTKARHKQTLEDAIQTCLDPGY